jgi:hypothetical protein
VEVGLTTKFLEQKVDNQMVSATIDEAEVKGGGEALIHLDDGFPISKKTSIEMKMKLTGSTKIGPEQGKSETIVQAVKTSTSVQLVGFVPGSDN